MRLIRWILSYRRRKRLAVELGVTKAQLDRVLKRLLEMEKGPHD